MQENKGLSDKYLDLVSKLHPRGKAFKYQLEWVRDTSRFKLAPKARQIGITTTEAVDKFIQCLLWKESDAQPLPPVIIFCSPSQRQSNRLMDYCMRIRDRFERLYQSPIKFRKEKEDRLTFTNFAELWSLPNNPRTIEGIDGSTGVIDEMGNFVGKEDEDVYQALMGSLAAKGGGLILFGKPHGRRGLFWKLYDPYGEYSQHYSIHKMDWTKRASEDGNYKRSVLEHKERMSALQFSENYEAEFVDENILVFPYDLLDRQSKEIKLYSLDDEYNLNLPTYIGIDFGKRESQTAVTIVEKSQEEGGSEKIKVIFHDVSAEKFDVQIEWIKKIITHFKPVIVNIDKTGAGIPIQDYLTATFGSIINGVHFNPGTKDKLVLNAKHLLEQGKLILPRQSTQLYEQIHGIEKVISETGTIKYSGKRSETDWLDDRAWSFFLSVFSLEDGQWGFSSIQYEKGKNTLHRDSAYDSFIRGEDV